MNDIIQYLIAIAIPTGVICWKVTERKAKPNKPRILYVMIATIVSTIIVYITIVFLMYLYIKLFYNIV